MKYEEIIRLLDAGYTRDEILEMQTETPEETPPEETPPEEKAPGEAPETAFTEMLSEMREAIADMRKEFTAFNIMTSARPEEEKRTSEDIIANIINPSMKKGDK